MLRIHFTGADLENVRVARRPDPLWEVVCSLCRLQSREGTVVFGPWRRSVERLLRRGGEARTAVTVLRSLVPRAAYFPDFLTPSVEEEPGDLDVLVDRVLATPRHRLRHEVALLSASGGRPWAGRELVRGDVPALTVLGGSLRTYHRELIAPLWNSIGAATEADVAMRGRALLHGGTRALLKSLRPMAVWEPPVLTVDYPVERDLHLHGRGLLLVPSYFCWQRPISLADDRLRPVLIYPVDKASSLTAASPAALSRLLGTTRAALLYKAAVRVCVTTSELAEATGMSLPTTSQQLAVLREGGLITSRRDGKHVLHTATPLGRRLLNGG
ncbi:helix-turn-helix transcriptional regulator [Streptomyces sp. RM72]|uniref:ArsR/SmtB family transcription factor n=1 Tax=unclassified Streptomyces TaxID=2593676 RepID=UPI000EF5C616|nr:MULTISPECIES: helix-turn-helix domain-containing protein [unclassified Streptomyces]MBQ0886261.1 helix-turn-helix transcriptional regulator [Streptomyces sp. RM72]